MLGTVPYWQRMIVLAPAFVIGVGLVIGVLILLGRSLADTIREVGHPRWWIASAVVLFALVVLLTYLGVSLPKEG